MAQIGWGRKARLYASTSGYTGSGLTLIRRTKDIKTTDEAKSVDAEARDLDYVVSDQGAKTFSLEFDKLLEADDSGSDVTLLRDAYDAGTPVYFVLCRKAKNLSSGKAIKFVGKVMQWPEEFPEGDSGKVSVVVKPCDPDNLPTRVDTPIS